MGFSEEKYFERKQLRDSTETPPLWPGTEKVFSSNLETGTVEHSTVRKEQRLLSWTCQGSSSVVKWVMSLQTQRAFYSPNSNSISGSQRMNGSRLAKECHSIHHIKFLITTLYHYRAKPSWGFLTSPVRPGPGIILNLRYKECSDWLSWARLTPWAALLGEGRARKYLEEEEEGL